VPSSSSSTALLARALAAQPSQRQFAVALGMSRERLNRVIRGEGGLSVKNVLRLAVLLDESPLVALRAFGYADEADLLAAVYGPPKLTRAQLDIAERFGKLSPKRKRTVVALLDESD
jgi:transcriptional regulator with XRE-family HTH domain